LGEVTDVRPGVVMMETPLGSQRVVMPLTGDLLPRIC
jgi:hydrogenase maturation factor